MINLNCANNRLTELDLSNNRALTTIYCGNQQATGLKVKAVEGGYEVCLKDYVSNVENIDISTVGANNYSARFLSYDGTTGTVLFAERPKTLHYQYMTHSPNNVKMDVTIKASFTVDVIERGGPTENIIYGIKDNCYLDAIGNALTEDSIAGLPAKKYAKKGFIADGISRLIVRVQASRPGNVTFSVDGNIGVQIEKLTDRANITGTNSYAATTRIAKDSHQASAVLVAPETYPSSKNFPSDKFTVHVKFTAIAENGEEIPEEERVIESDIELELHAAPVVLIHGFSGKANAENTFGIKENIGIYRALKDAKFSVSWWNYDGTKGPSVVLANDYNGLFSTILLACEEFRRKDIVCTKADLVAYSMGGLMARYFCLPQSSSFDGNYYTFRSYKQGMVRRIVDIAVPNRGSPWANFFCRDFSVMNTNVNFMEMSISGWLMITEPLIKAAVEKLMNSGRNSDTAWADMSINGWITSGAYPVNVPMYSIYGEVMQDIKNFMTVVDFVSFLKTGGMYVNKHYMEEGMEYIEFLEKFKDTIDLSNSAVSMLNDVTPVHPLFTSLLQAAQLMLSATPAGLAKELAMQLPGVINEVFFLNDEHDLCVSAKSAAVDFAGASEGRRGFFRYNHRTICKQDDIGREVAAKLKGSKSAFKVFTSLSSSSYSGFENMNANKANTSRVYADGEETPLDPDEVYEEHFTLSIQKENADAEGNTLVSVTAKADLDVDSSVYIVIQKDGQDRIFTTASSDARTFGKSIVFTSRDVGAFTAYCFCGGGESRIYTSGQTEFIVQASLSGAEIQRLYFAEDGSVIFTEADSELGLELYAEASDGRIFSVSSSAMGTVWKSSNPDIAYVTDDGMIHAIANGTAKITAEYAGLSASIFINVGNEFTAPQILTSTANNAEEGLEYSYTLQASGTPHISWRLIDGRLPGGLELSSSGEISGTPEEQGKFTFTVEASNIAGSDSREVSITVGASTGNYTIFTEENFTDEIFRNFILSAIDYDNNGYVSDEEITSTKVVNVSGQGISSLKGIEYFTSLEYLTCDNNNISELDLSANVNLLGLACGNNSLKALDLSNHQKLQGIWGTDNNLESLNVDNCPALEVISVFRNNLSSIELKDCPSLKELSCWGNSIVEIDISGCPNLDPDKFYYDQNVTVIRSRPAFKVANLILSGQIGVNFFLNLPEIQGVDYYNGKSCYMAFDINGNNTSNNPQPTDGSFKQENYFGYRCYVNSVQMADPITADFHYGDGKTVSYVYTVQRYLDNKITGSKDEAMRKLAAAIKNYGHYAQVYLSRINGWEIGVKHVELEAASEYTSSEIEEVRQIAPQYKPVLDDFSDTGITGVQYNLELAAETTINLTLKVDSGYSGNVFASLNGGSENMAVCQADGTYRVQIAGISAHRLADTQTVKVTAAKDFTVKVSALTFVYNSLRNTSTAEDRQKLAVALYRYYTSTMDYKNSPKN